MPINPEIRKVLVIGSGPIVIGQAAEFDYAGTQACRSLKEEGIEVVLVNSNPATIMTDQDIADHVYIEPLNLASVTQIIEMERPDSILPTLGGQIGLNMAMQLHENGTLEKYGIKMLGTSADSIRGQKIGRDSRIPWKRSTNPVWKALWWRRWKTLWPLRTRLDIR